MDQEKPEQIKLSPYDTAFPAKLLSNSLKGQLKKAEDIAENVYREVAKVSSVIAQVHESNKKGFRLVVDATESTLDAIESGKIKLTTENSGKMYAQIREANGHYGSKLPIKEEVFYSRTAE